MAGLEDIRQAFTGRYTVDAEIGEGGSARVYSAKDIKHDRRVAIKILKSDVVEGIAADRFLREIRVDASLQHPRILPLFDSGVVLGSPYFVMPFVQGETLRTLLDQSKTLSVADAVSITVQIADALQYLHSRDLVHRDVKPENILLQDKHVWLADFGIVRALQEAITGNVTRTGTAVGTPAYMSPEQRFGAPSIDGRSDQFSLACVLYEMLTGHSPKVFERRSVAATPNSPRITPTSALRSGVSKQLDEVIARALELHEDDRWPSIQIFAEQLQDAAAALSVVKVRRIWPRSRSMTAAAIALMGMGAIWYALIPGAGTLDAYTVAVLPLAHEGDTTGVLLDGDDCSRFLRDAIGRWSGIRHVDDMRLRDARLRMGRPEKLADAMKMAKHLGAGLAVWGVVGPVTSTPNNATRAVRLFLYDVAAGTSRDEVSGIIDAHGNLDQTFQLLADSLISGIAGTSPARVSGSRNFVAVRAYLDGHRALNNFDLATASTAFRHATDADPGFGLAFLWLAWSTMWAPDANTRDWGMAASRALAVGSGLSARDSAHARALVAMNELRFVDACTDLRALTQSDSRDFAAWYALGECLSSDFAVLIDTASPSGWRFRTSMRESVGAYEKAVDLVPSFTDAMGQRAMQRISRWLYAETGRYRAGLSADSVRFAAWPSLSHDTLAFIPFPERAVFAESAGTRDKSYHDALQRNGARVRAIVARWATLDSTNVVALEALAMARESNDELMTLRRTDEISNLTGMEALKHALMYADRETAVRLETVRVRFLIKTDRYTEAKHLTDSLLAAVNVSSATSSTASWMCSLSSLSGRLGSAIEWCRKSAVFRYSDPLRSDLSVSPALSAGAADAAIFASLGAPADSTKAALQRIELAIAQQPPGEAEILRQLYVEQPRIYAWPALGDATVPPTRASAGNRWLTTQLRIAAGDTASARQQMWQADSSAARNSVSRIAFEIALVNAHLWLALHDTASATRSVNNAVTLVAGSGEQLLKRPSATAAFVRLLILRATLADAAGDSALSRAWATRAATLWRDADPMLVSQLPRAQRNQK